MERKDDVAGDLEIGNFRILPLQSSYWVQVLHVKTREMYLRDLHEHLQLQCMNGANILSAYHTRTAWTRPEKHGHEHSSTNKALTLTKAIPERMLMSLSTTGEYRDFHLGDRHRQSRSLRMTFAHEPTSIKHPRSGSFDIMATKHVAQCGRSCISNVVE